MTVGLKELAWMATARRRDAWDRWSQLLSLVDCRTIWGDGAKAKSPGEWFPQTLMTETERRNLKAALAPVKITLDEVCEMMGLQTTT